MLEQYLQTYYENHINPRYPLNENHIQKFIKYYCKEIKISNFINPYAFANQENININEVIQIFTQFTNETSTEGPFLKLVTYYQCTLNECYTEIILNSDLELDESRNFYCKNCDQDYNLINIKHDINILYMFPSRYKDLTNLLTQDNIVDKLLTTDSGSKFSPPSYHESIELTDRDMEGGINTERFNLIVKEGNYSEKSPAQELNQLFSQELAAKYG